MHVVIANLALCRHADALSQSTAPKVGYVHQQWAHQARLPQTGDRLLTAGLLSNKAPDLDVPLQHPSAASAINSFNSLDLGCWNLAKSSHQQQ